MEQIVCLECFVTYLKQLLMVVLKRAPRRKKNHNHFMNVQSYNVYFKIRWTDGIVNEYLKALQIFEKTSPKAVYSLFLKKLNL